MFRRVLCLALPCLFLALCLSVGQEQGENKAQPDSLPSWTDGPAKKAILDFVRATTDKASPKYVPVAERIATFDNDGTLWAEQPLYPQLMFIFDRVKVLAAKNPDWKDKEPFKAILDGDKEAMARLGKKDLLHLMAATHAGMSSADFHQIAVDWLMTAKHPRFKKLYTECVYQPMLEVMKYLRASGFKTYIVTGGGQAFVRAFSEQTYGIPPEQVIGTALKLKYVKKDDGPPVMMRLPALLLLDDEEGKPEDIELFIGRKPLCAFGNSNGDRQMLEWTQSGGGTRLMMLVHHDDAKREYAYGAKSKIGTFSDSLMAEAMKQGWHVISMKDDWKQVFPAEAVGKLPTKLVGKWVVVGGEQDGATFDFSSDGAMIGKINLKGNEANIDAKVRVEGDKLFVTTRNPRTGKDDMRIQIIRTLTAEELVLEANGKKLKMERAK